MYSVSRTHTYAKLFFLVSISGLFMYIVLAFSSFHTAYTTISQISQYQDRLRKYRNLDLVLERYGKDLKYILLWTLNGNEKNPVGEGSNPFIDNRCSNINCYFTTNKTILKGDYRNFDAIVFDMNILKVWNNSNVLKRSPAQKFIFHGMVPSEDHPICDEVLDNYFNWTWSYKLFSEIFTPFIEVRDLGGRIVAPKSEVDWIVENKESYMGAPNLLRIRKGFVNRSSIDEVNTKTKALAWVMNKCQTKLNRMLFAKELQMAMKYHSLYFDIYGCGNLECPDGNCGKMIESQYYFYLAYEESISEDYVTDEVLMAYHHGAVPIVMGGAEYSKFLPQNSYIEARNYTPRQLAALMSYIIGNPYVYREYFNWKFYYTIHAVSPDRGLCILCSILNNDDQNDIVSTYETFRKWWYYGPLKERCSDKGVDVNNSVNYANETNLKNVTDVNI